MKICFIIIRHVNSKETNKYWLYCYLSIRKYYSNQIIIIDDNSDKNFVSNIELENTIIIQSEFPKRAELLPYYYFHKYQWGTHAVIIHDSAFILQKINFPETDIKFLWHFEKFTGSKNYIFPLLKYIKNENKIRKWLKKYSFQGCFGVQSLISLNFITELEEKYNFFNLLKIINTRPLRMKLERLFALLCFIENDKLKLNPSICGSIFSQKNKFTLKFNNYIINKEKYKNLKIVKVWTGR